MPGCGANGQRFGRVYHGRVVVIRRCGARVLRVPAERALPLLWLMAERGRGSDAGGGEPQGSETGVARGRR